MQLYPTIGKKTLIEKYIDNKIAIKVIAKEYGRGWKTIRNWLEYYNIPIRTMSEQAKIRSNLTGHWKGGDHPTKNLVIKKKMYINRKMPCGNDHYWRNHPITLEMREKMSRAKRKNTTPLYVQIRNSMKAINWRKEIFKRDSFTCKVCGKHTRTLEAHHIVSFVGLFRRFKIKTFDEAMDKEELWNLDNGITLCQKCHKLTSNYGGRGYND